MLLLLVLLLLVFNANSVSNDIIGKQSFITHTTWRRCRRRRRCLRRAKIYLFSACSKGVVWYVWCHSFDSYKRRKVIRNLISRFCVAVHVVRQAVHVKLRQAVHWPHAQQTLLWLRIMNFYWFWHSSCRHKQKHGHTHTHTHMWSHSNTYSLSGHALSALSTCCGERERERRMNHNNTSNWTQTAAAPTTSKT